MRTAIAIVASLFLYSTAVFAQPLIGAEILSNPLRPRNALETVAAPAVAMARDREGVVIAWTMRNFRGADAIHVVRLNAAGGVAGPITEMPMAEDAVDANCPSIAVSPTGSGFTLAWMERSRTLQLQAERAVFCQLDADLKPSVPRVLTSTSSETIQSTVIVRSGRSTWVAARSSLWQVRADGSVDRPVDAGTPISDMTASADFPQLVSGQRIATGFTCRQEPNCQAHGGPFNGFCYESCRLYEYSFSLHFVSLYSVSLAHRFSLDSNTQPAIQGDGREVIVAWFSGLDRTGGRVTAARWSSTSFASFPQDLQRGQVIGNFSQDPGHTRPDIATDGDRYVVVWRTTTLTGDHDIVGASIDRDGSVTPLSIATSIADERDPSVLATATGTFLVAYEKVHAGDRRIAGRFVRFGSRRRAVH